MQKLDVFWKSYHSKTWKWSSQMKKYLIGGLSSILGLSLIFTSLQFTEAASYYGHDGSVSENLEKTVVKPYPGKKDTWTYVVKACATTHNLGIAGVILKSDIDQQVLGVNKSLAKGKCSFYGAVMKAKDGKTLGAELILTSQAVEKMQQILKDSPNVSDVQRKSMMKEFIRLYTMTGLMPRVIPDTNS